MRTEDEAFGAHFETVEIACRTLREERIAMFDPDALANRFDYHPPQDEKTKHMHEAVRARCGSLAQFFNELLPPSRETALTIGRLEEVMFWANAAIARNPEGAPTTVEEPNIE